MTATAITSSEFKLHLGEYFTAAMKKPVVVTRRKEKAVLLSKEEYDHLQALEDAYWIAKAEAGDQSGYLGAEKTMRKLSFLLNSTEEV